MAGVSLGWREGDIAVMQQGTIYIRGDLDTEDYRQKDRKSINRIKIWATVQTKASTSRQYNRVKNKAGRAKQ
jgi:hypothetical protein